MFDRLSYIKRLEKYVSEIKRHILSKPEIAIVLGSGLGGFADNLEVEAIVEYKELDGFPVSTAPGHEGSFIFGKLCGRSVVCMKGRVHYYEGYDMSEVVLPLRVLGLLGAETVIITNAVGSMRKEMPVGSFMVSKDCISSFVPSPLRGPNIDMLGERFTDVSEIYDKIIIEKVLEIGRENNITITEGVFIQLPGPQFETSSEIKMYREAGADCCGMSSAVEAIAARHMGMKTAGISCITNYCTGISEEKLSGEEVIEVASRVSSDFELVIKKLVERL